MSNEIENIISHIQPFEDSLKVNEYIEEFKRENKYLKTMNEELKQQKAELVELLTECYKRFKDYEMDVDTDRPIHHIRFMEKLQKYIKTGGE